MENRTWSLLWNAGVSVRRRAYGASRRPCARRPPGYRRPPYRKPDLSRRSRHTAKRILMRDEHAGGDQGLRRLRSHDHRWRAGRTTSWWLIFLNQRTCPRSASWAECACTKRGRLDIATGSDLASEGTVLSDREPMPACIGGGASVRWCDVTTPRVDCLWSDRRRELVRTRCVHRTLDQSRLRRVSQEPIVGRLGQARVRAGADALRRHSDAAAQAAASGRPPRLGLHA